MTIFSGPSQSHGYSTNTVFTNLVIHLVGSDALMPEARYMIIEHPKSQKVLKSHDWFKIYGHVMWFILNGFILLSEEAYYFVYTTKQITIW